MPEFWGSFSLCAADIFVHDLCRVESQRYAPPRPLPPTPPSNMKKRKTIKRHRLRHQLSQHIHVLPLWKLALFCQFIGFIWDNQDFGVFSETIFQLLSCSGKLISKLALFLGNRVSIFNGTCVSEDGDKSRFQTILWLSYFPIIPKIMSIEISDV